ncbi:MAG: DUF72 domain-containing protein [Melioribacteraceae bacterium]|nr:DUF72 domain-containing protein [Melioribacteraceae bacterium]
MNIPKLYIGTAGWSYDDWVGSFYPFSQSKEFSWLKYYSRFFNMVEVNSTYYTYLAPYVVNSWLRQTENVDDFLFTMKLHKDFTHKRQYGDNQIKAVQQNLDILKREERLGGLLLQFPYSFDFNDGNVNYLRELIQKFDGYEKFVEVRHRSWQNKKASTITFCTIDQPQIGEAIKFKPIVGNDAAYIRFHGRNEEAWRRSLNNFGKKQTYEQQSARYEYLYSPGELTEIDQKLKEIYDKVKKVFVVMNNHPHGDAVANAFELLHLLKDRVKIKMPPTIIKAYPRLKEFSQN